MERRAGGLGCKGPSPSGVVPFVESADTEAGLGPHVRCSWVGSERGLLLHFGNLCVCPQSVHRHVLCWWGYRLLSPDLLR